MLYMAEWRHLSSNNAQPRSTCNVITIYQYRAANISCLLVCIVQSTQLQSAENKRYDHV